MIPQFLIALSPFLAVIYILFAFIQALRKKQQGIFAGVLALVALVVPLVALVQSQNVLARTALLNALTLNAVIVFVGSILVLLLERRNKTRAAGRSYGMLGIGVGVVFAALTVIYPLLNTTQAANTAAGRGDSTLQNVALVAQDGETPSTAFADVLVAQTGLASEEITTQLEGGSTIAALVAANDGDLDAVIAAAATALDALAAEGGMASQMLTRLGDTTTAATQFVNGEINERAQQLLIGVLMTGEMPTFPGGNGAPPGGGTGSGSFTPPTGADGSFNPPTDGSFNPGAGAPVEGQGVADVASEPTVEVTDVPATPTTPVIRPTLIAFPSATPTPDVTAVVSEETESEAETVQAAATCALTTTYNLNLRDEPSTESNVYLSIPFGTVVLADAQADGWYSVSYDGQAGWVSAEYVTTDGTCAALASAN